MHDDSPLIYEVAQLCINGHVINPMTRAHRESNQRFCDECGAQTITDCGSCKQPIRGPYLEYIGTSAFSAPAYCVYCGKPFPWTETGIQAALELAAETSLNAEERQTFADSLDDLVGNTARAELGKMRMKRLLEKMGVESAAAMRGVLISVLSEAAKRGLFT